MQRRWHYLYVIIYPSLEHKIYYGSRITTCHPNRDTRYFGSPVTFARYNDPTHEEYQTDAVKVILRARKIQCSIKNLRWLLEEEGRLISDALNAKAFCGSCNCLNRNINGRFLLTTVERTEIGKRSAAAGNGFSGMRKREHRKHASAGGTKSYALGVGIHGMSKRKLRAAQEKGRKTIIARYAKMYTFISPRHTRVIVKNLSQFCRDNDLNRGHMYSVAGGKLLSHKGWRRG